MRKTPRRASPRRCVVACRGGGSQGARASSSFWGRSFMPSAHRFEVPNGLAAGGFSLAIFRHSPRQSVSLPIVASRSIVMNGLLRLYVVLTHDRIRCSQHPGHHRAACLFRMPWP